MTKGLDARGTYDWLKEASSQIAGGPGGGRGTNALMQVAMFSNVPAAKAFARELHDEMWRIAHLIDDYVFMNADLSRPPPAWRGGKARRRRGGKRRGTGLVAAAKALKQAWR